MTFSGNLLAELEPIEPMVSPRIETTVSSDYKYDINVMQVITSNKDGRMVNDRIIDILWTDNDYIADSTYVKLGEFSGNADYNLTISGKHTVDSSTAMQILSGLTLLLIPSSVNEDFDLIYTLENVSTGKVYTASAKETMSTTMWILFLPALPFSLIGSLNTVEHISEHIYQDFVKQGAFSTLETDRARNVEEVAQPTNVANTNSEITVKAMGTDNALQEIAPMPSEPISPFASEVSETKEIAQTSSELKEQVVTEATKKYNNNECIQNVKKSAPFSIKLNELISINKYDYERKKIEFLDAIHAVCS